MIRADTWGTQEQAIRIIAGEEGTIKRHETLPIVGVTRHFSHGSVSRFTMAIWNGKAAKPSHHYSFITQETLQKNFDYYWQRSEKILRQREERKREKSAKRANLRAADHWAVGDVIYNSWGYDQTNIDYYQVVEVKDRVIVVRPIRQDYKETGNMCGWTQPRRNEFRGDPVTKPLDENGRISFKYGGSCKWAGQPVWSSHYA